MISIVLADEHRVVREGLSALMQSVPDFRISAQAETGLEAVQQVEDLKPDILVTDIAIPEMNGNEVTRQVHKRSPDTKVVILTTYEDEAHVLSALRAGARGYVLKRSGFEELADSIRRVNAGGRYLSNVISDRVLNVYVETARNSHDVLTAREREVLHLAAEGHTNEEIARRLCISRRTTETHRANMMHKLGLKTYTELVRFAMREGLVA